MNPNRHLTTATQRRQRGSFRRHRKPRRRMIKEGDSFNRRSIALACLDTQRSLPRRRTETLRIKLLAHPVRLAQSLQPRGGKQNRIHLPLGQLAQPRVHVAAEFDRIDIRPQRLQLRSPPLTARPHLCALRQCRQAFVFN